MLKDVAGHEGVPSEGSDIEQDVIVQDSPVGGAVLCLSDRSIINLPRASVEPVASWIAMVYGPGARPVSASHTSDP